MKNPKDPNDPFDRHNAAGAATVIIGESTSNSAPTALVNVESGAERSQQKSQANNAIQDDPGRTRILNPYANVTKESKTTEPVVGWLVILKGPGKGNHRPIFYGSNTIGRNANQRIAIDFGDDAISGEQQAYLVYDGKKRQFQLVPNLGRQNLVHLNGSALLSNMEIKAKDRIMMGQTEMLFVPLCGPDFDWSDEA
jgi:hypothetical protein